MIEILKNLRWSCTLNSTLDKLGKCCYVTDALKMDGDDVMVDIYESVQDELRMKNKQLMKERQKVWDLDAILCPISVLSFSLSK